MNGLYAKPLPRLARRLARKYRGVQIRECYRSETYDGEPQQVVAFRARRSTLIRCGLATAAMFEDSRDQRRIGPGPESGDCYSLLDVTLPSSPDVWDLYIYTRLHGTRADKRCEAKRLQAEVARMLKRAFSAPRGESRA